MGFFGSTFLFNSTIFIHLLCVLNGFTLNRAIALVRGHFFHGWKVRLNSAMKSAREGSSGPPMKSASWLAISRPNRYGDIPAPNATTWVKGRSETSIFFSSSSRSRTSSISTSGANLLASFSIASRYSFGTFQHRIFAIVVTFLSYFTPSTINAPMQIAPKTKSMIPNLSKLRALNFQKGACINAANSITATQTAMRPNTSCETPVTHNTSEASNFIEWLAPNIFPLLPTCFGTPLHF